MNKIKSVFIPLILFLSVLTIVPSLAEAANTYYIATDGNNTTGDGSVTKPWATVQYALGKVSAGDTIKIRGGDYPSQGTININNPTNHTSLTITAEDPLNPPRFLGTDANKQRIVISDGVKGVTISYLKIRMAANPFDTSWGMAINIREYPATIDNVEIWNGGQGINIDTSQQVTITNTYIHDMGVSGQNNQGIAIHNFQRDPIATGWNEKIYIKNCRIDKVWGDGIYEGSTQSNCQSANPGGSCTDPNYPYKVKYVEVDSCEVSNTREDSVDFKGTYYAKVHHSKLYSSQQCPIATNQGYGGQKFIEIYNNIMYDHWWMAINAVKDGGSNWQIYNNIIYNTMNNPPWDAPTVSLGADSVFYHNTLVNNYCYGVEGYSSTSVIKDNAFYNNGVGSYACKVTGSQKGNIWQGSKGTIDYNYVYPTTPGITGTNPVIDPDPLFSDPNNADFTLKSSSSLIDAGIYVGIIADFAGTSRPQGAGYDIGAYEYISSAIPISSCQALNTAGRYALSADIGSETSPVDITSAGSCFDVTADNVTLDLNGKNVVTSLTSGSASIVKVTGANFVLDNSASTISNLKQADANKVKELRAITISGNTATIGNASSQNISMYWYGGTDWDGLIYSVSSAGPHTIRNLILSASNDGSSFSSPRNNGTAVSIIYLNDISGGAIITNNNITAYVPQADQAAISLNWTSPTVLDNNNITNEDGFCITLLGGRSLSSPANSISGTGNTCNGGRLLIYDNPQNQTISAELDAAEILINRGDNLTISNNNLSNGLHLFETKNTTISNNKICLQAGGTCTDYAKGGVSVYGGDSLDHKLTFSGNEIWGGGGRRYWQHAFQLRGIKGVSVTNNTIKSVGTMGVYFYEVPQPENIVFNSNKIDLLSCTNPGCTNSGAIYMRRGKNVSYTNDIITSNGAGVTTSDAFSLDGITPDLKFTNVSITNPISEPDYWMQDGQADGKPNIMLIINPPTIPTFRFNFVQFGNLPKAQIRRYLNAQVKDNLGNPIEAAAVSCQTTSGGSGTCDGYPYPDPLTDPSGQAPQNSISVIDRIIEATGSCSDSTPCSQQTTYYAHTVSATKNSLSDTDSLCLDGSPTCDTAFASPTLVNLTLTDITPPDKPTGLSATAVSSSQINLSWSASTDNVGVAGYYIYRYDQSGNLLATLSSLLATYNDTGLQPATTYTYTVSAYDAAGNPSNQSAPASETTQNVIMPVFEGFGANVTGGAGGTVYTVTNLNDSGAGSLREGLQNGASNRIVKFAVSGTINLLSTLRITGQNITIDGFSTSEPAITISGSAVEIAGSMTGPTTQGSNIIIQGLRFRDVINDDLLRIAYNAHDIVIDHNSFSNGGDGNLDITEGAYNVTVSWNIFAKNKASGASLIATDASRISLHHNIYYNNTKRNCIAVGSKRNYSSGPNQPEPIVDMRYNIVWGYAEGTYISSKDGYTGSANVASNLYSTSTAWAGAAQRNNIVRITQDSNSPIAHAYVAGNIAIQDSRGYAYPYPYLDGIGYKIYISSTNSQIDSPEYPVPAITGPSITDQTGRLSEWTKVKNNVGVISKFTDDVVDSEVRQTIAIPDISIFSQPWNVDITPPVRSNGLPSGALPAGTTSTDLSLTTDENATCRYSTMAGVAYNSMTNTFSTTGATSHSTVISGLINGNTYNYYVRCQDTTGTANPDDYPISFSVSSAGASMTYYVATDGVDSLTRDGSSGQPWATVNYAISRSNAGDTIKIKPGNYDIDKEAGRRIQVTKANLTITASDPINPPSIENNGSGVPWQGGIDVRAPVSLSYLIVDMKNRSGSWGPICIRLWPGSEGSSLDNIVTRNAFSGVVIDAGKNITITNCTSYEHGTSGSDPGTGNGSGFQTVDVGTATSWDEKILFKNCTAYNAGGDGVLIGMPLVGDVTKWKSYIEFDNVNFYNNTEDGIDMKNADYVRIHHSQIHDNGGDGILGHDGDTANGTAKNVEVYNNRIYNNGWWGVYTGTGGNWNVYDNLIYNNANRTDYVLYATNGMASSNATNNIYHNVFYNNGTVIGTGKAHGGIRGSAANIKNNIFYNNGTGSGNSGNIFTTMSGVIDYNYVYPVSPGITGTNAITDPDPQLSDPTNADFTLKSGSPLIDAGIDVGITEDFAGTSRPQGSGYDIGAYEYVSTAIPISSCQPLNTAGRYALSADIGSEASPVDITSAGSCFDVSADNVTLDLNGKNVVTSLTSGSASIIKVTGANFVLDNSASTISNLKQADANKVVNLAAVNLQGANATVGSASSKNINIYGYGFRQTGCGLIYSAYSPGPYTIRNLILSSSNDNSSSAPRNIGYGEPLIYMYSVSVGVTIESNNITAYLPQADRAAIFTSWTFPFVLNNNNITNEDGFCITLPGGRFLSSPVNSISGTGNTCNGGPLLIYDNPQNQTISGLDAAEVLINLGDNLTISNNNISNGLHLWETKNTTISNNKICLQIGGTCTDYAKGGVSVYGGDSVDHKLTFSGNEIWGGGGRRYWQHAFQLRGIKGVSVTNNTIKSAGTMGVYFYAAPHPTDIVFNSNKIDLQSCTNPGCTNLGAILMRRGKNVTYTNDVITSNGVGVILSEAFSVDPAVPDLKFTNVKINSASGVDYNIRNTDTTYSEPDSNTVLIINPPTIPTFRFNFVEFGNPPKAQIRRFLNAQVKDNLGNPIEAAAVSCQTTTGGSGTCDGYPDQLTDTLGQAPQNSLSVIDRIVEAVGSCSSNIPCSQQATYYAHTLTATKNSLSDTDSLCLDGSPTCDTAFASPTLVNLILAGGTPPTPPAWVDPNSALAKGLHPRIWITEKDLPLLRQKLLPGGVMNSQFEMFKEQIRGATNLYDWDAVSCAFLYQILKESNLTDALFFANKSITWQKSVLGGWGSEDNVLSLAVAYDWTYEVMNDSDRIAIAEDLSRQASNIRNDKWDYESPLHNYFYSLHMTSALAGLSIYGVGISNPNVASDLINNVQIHLSDLKDMFNEQFYEGMWHEGLGYSQEVVRFGLYFLDAWKTATGEDLLSQIKFFQNNHYTFIYSYRPDYLPYKGMDFSYNNPVWAWKNVHIQLFLLKNYKDPYLKWVFDNYILGNYQWPYASGLINLFYMMNYDPGIASSPISQLELAKKFNGNVFARSDWGNDATWLSFSANNHYYAHGHQDENSFTLFKYSPLAVESGQYTGSTGTSHSKNYYTRTVAHNSMLIYDPNEVFLRTSAPDTLSNDGGQRISNWTNPDCLAYKNSPCSPYAPSKTTGDWLTYYNDQDFHADDDLDVTSYHKSDILKYENNDQSGYMFLAADATKAYDANKLKLFVRETVFLRPDFLVIFDRVNASNSNFTKKWLLHSVNMPTLDGTETIERGVSSNGITKSNDTNLITMANNNGKLFTTILLPLTRTVRKIGGNDYRYWVDDPGQNYQETIQNDMLQESGQWRIEVEPAVSQENDLFLNVLYPTGAPTPSMPQTTLISGDTMVGALIDDPITPRIVMFSQDPQGVSVSNVTYTVNYSSSLVGKHLLVDMSAGTYDVYKNGTKILSAIPASDQGVLSFESSGGSTFSIVPAGQSPPDTTSPQGTITINNGEEYTRSTSVSLTLSATDVSGVEEMMFSNDDVVYSLAEAYATTKRWTLETGDGTKTVYVKFKDVAGNWSAPVSDTITLDTTPPQAPKGVRVK